MTADNGVCKVYTRAQPTLFWRRRKRTEGFYHNVNNAEKLLANNPTTPSTANKIMIAWRRFFLDIDNFEVLSFAEADDIELAGVDDFFGIGWFMVGREELHRALVNQAAQLRITFFRQARFG